MSDRHKRLFLAAFIANMLAAWVSVASAVYSKSNYDWMVCAARSGPGSCSIGQVKASGDALFSFVDRMLGHV